MSLNKLILRTIYMQEENRVRLMAAKLFRKRQDKKKSEYKYMHDWDEPGKAPASDSAKAQGPQIWYCGNKAESDECSCHSIWTSATQGGHIFQSSFLCAALLHLLPLALTMIIITHPLRLITNHVPNIRKLKT
jgi:hypothetical protein